MRPKPNRQNFKLSNNQREDHKAGGKLPHSIFRHVRKGGVSNIPGTYSYPSNVVLSAIPLGGRIRRPNGYGFFDDVGAWFKRLFSRSNTNQIASNLLKKGLPFVTNLAGEILTDKALHANPLDTIKKHAFRNVKNLLNEENHENEGGIIRKSTNARAKAAYKKYVKKNKGGAILTD